MTPAEFLLLLVLREAPRIAKHPELEAAWRADVAEAVELDRRVGAVGALVSPDVDAALLDAARWYEARLKNRPKDGDCRTEEDKKSPSGVRTVCRAIGPLQVTIAAYRAVLGTPDADLAGLEGEPRTATATRLRDPETGVRAGYGGLLRWKRLCGGTPARWLTAWGWGKCPPERAIDAEAVRRCELATVLLQSRGQAGGWECGHAGRKIQNTHDARLLKWARARATSKDGS
jgi:hypothetical protein